MKKKGRFIKAVFISILFLACISSIHLRALDNGTSEWEIKVIAEKSKIRLEPALESPVAAILPQGSILKSYEQVGEWFRVIITDEKGFAVIGYVPSGDVEILKKKKSPAMDYWDEELGFFEGINLSIKFMVGLNYFSGGDISDGTRGIYDSVAESISLLGNKESRRFKPFHIGYDITADIIYNFSSHLGVGLGLGYFFATYKNTATFKNKEVFGLYSYMDSAPTIKAVPIRLGLFLTFPVHNTLSICLNAGPALNLVEYSYSLRYVIRTPSSDLPPKLATVHKATSHGLGFQGGVGLEINLNPRVIFFIEGQGRYARITNFKGKIQSREFSLMDSKKVEGIFYYLTGEKHPSLTVFEEDAPMDKTARKAVFDFSGFTIRTGIRLRF